MNEISLRKLKKLTLLSCFKNHFSTPPILIFFVTSACNSRCPHCFYRNNLNQKNDLSLEEIKKINLSLGKVYQLLLSGGEPFLRKDLARVCEQFYSNNHLEELQIPTNSLLVKKIGQTTGEILKNCPRLELNLNLSLDGTKKIHEQMRGVKGSFDKVLANYHSLKKLQRQFPRLVINITSTVTRKNIDDLFDLIDLVKEKMPGVQHHYLGYERGRFYTDKVDRPLLSKLSQLNQKVEAVYQSRSGHFYTNLTRKIDSTKLKSLKEKRQVVPCLAGKLVGVIYEDGQVANCEMLPTAGKVKNGDFRAAWMNKARIKQLEKIIRKQVCHCTHECFLSPSVLYQNLFKTIKSSVEF